MNQITEMESVKSLFIFGNINHYRLILGFNYFYFQVETKLFKCEGPNVEVNTKQGAG